ncbi:FAD-dependent oxidoreductase [Candidatus Roizmanbacteria bacterium]|nr:FAD-dependent oxidoreductase [Candidatus Roizmanbacteria bacterium]
MSKDTGIHNLIIIGGGPSGLSAALYAARAELKPLVFAGSPPGGQLTLTSEIENFPGQTNITGPELVLKMREQATHFGAQIIDENLLSVDFKNEIHSSSFRFDTNGKRIQNTDQLHFHHLELRPRFKMAAEYI